MELDAEYEWLSNSRALRIDLPNEDREASSMSTYKPFLGLPRLEIWSVICILAGYPSLLSRAPTMCCTVSLQYRSFNIYILRNLTSIYASDSYLFYLILYFLHTVYYVHESTVYSINGLCQSMNITHTETPAPVVHTLAASLHRQRATHQKRSNFVTFDPSICKSYKFDYFYLFWMSGYRGQMVHAKSHDTMRVALKNVLCYCLSVNIA